MSIGRPKNYENLEPGEQYNKQKNRENYNKAVIMAKSKGLNTVVELLEEMEEVHKNDKEERKDLRNTKRVRL